MNARNRTSTVSTFAALVIIGLIFGSVSANAAVMTASLTAPPIDGADIANLGTSTRTDKWWCGSSPAWNRAGSPKGQTFTTPDSDVLLNALTYRISPTHKAEPTKEYVLRVGTITRTDPTDASTWVFTQIHTETATQDFTWNAGTPDTSEYMTWTFKAPVLLSADTEYGIDVGMISSTSDWESGIPYLQVTNDVYAGGTRYVSGTEGFGIGDTTMNNVAYDRVFHLDMATAVGSVDFDQDGNVNVVDLNLLTAEADLTAGLTVPPAGARFDLNGDDMVDSADLDRWLSAAATINGHGSPYVKGDTNLDGDVDIWSFDGSGDAQVLSERLGTLSGAVWSDGDFNGDGDVDIWEFSGFGDAQTLAANLGATNDAAAGTAEAIYNTLTGELSFNLGEGVAVIGLTAEGMDHGAVDIGSPLGVPGQNGNDVLAYFNTSGLPAGMAGVGKVLPMGLTADAISFSYTPIGGPTTSVAVTVIVPEPSMIVMLAILGMIGIFWKRRNR